MNTTTKQAAQSSRCDCGAVFGQRCEHMVTDADAIYIIWMPPYLRASHEAAGNSGRYPHNGSICLRLAPDCADSVRETEGDWAIEGES